ncbi:thiamine phosphate synthase, partial [Bordetella petrii]|nr:thiamine phosphate synthase [Bordetella petrii]
MQPSRRAFLLGRRPPSTPWDAFRRRLERTAQGRVDELEPGPNGRAWLQPTRREDVRHARALCQEYGVALLLHGVDGVHVPAMRPVLYVDPSLLIGLVPGEQPGQWHAQAGCRLGELADAGLPQFAGAPEHATLAAWLAGSQG